MPDGTLAHLRLAEREGFDPPCPLGLRFSRPTHLPILPPLQMVAREGVAPPSLELSAFRPDDGWEGHLLGHPTDGAVWNTLEEVWDDVFQVNQQQARNEIHP